jgi:sodium-independent sulfate anion transporter 11
MTQSTTGDRIKRFFGIDPEDRLNDTAFFDDGSFLEEEVSTKDWLRSLFPTGAGIAAYLRELFPFLGWIFHYNLTWLLGDLIAGAHGPQHPQKRRR